MASMEQQTAEKNNAQPVGTAEGTTQPLWTNQYQPTEQINRQISRARIQRWYTVLCLASAAILIICSVFLVFLLQYLSPVYLVLIPVFAVAGIFILVWPFWLMPCVYAKKMKRQQQLLYPDQEVAAVIHLYPDYLQLQSGTQFPYSKMTRMKETRHVCVITFAKAVAVPLKKDAFLNGSWNEIQPFLKLQLENARNSSK